VVVDLTLQIDHLPERGGDIFATKNGISAGGGYNVLYAIRRLGAPAAYMGAIGTGSMASIATSALNSIGVEVGGAQLPDIDTGYSVAMTEPSGERTFVSTRGAETRVPADFYEKLSLVEGDVIYLSGYSFAHAMNREALERFARKNAGWNGPVLFDIGPMVRDLPDDSLAAVQLLRPIWSVNEREGGILIERFGLEASVPNVPADSPEHHAAVASALSQHLGSSVILRAGAAGAWFARATAKAAASSGAGDAVTYVPTPHVTAVDTNGAGDAHSGALCAGLFQHRPLDKALLYANCAGALSTTKEGPATCPSLDEIEAAAKKLQ
jgi:sugar/nucleoside kinase (ribokinase family)